MRPAPDFARSKLDERRNRPKSLDRRRPADAARWRPTRRALQDEQRRRRRHVAVLAQHLPGVREIAASTGRGRPAPYPARAGRQDAGECPRNRRARSPLRARKSSSAGRSSRRMSEGSSGLSTTPKPFSLMSQPMMCSVSGQQCSPIAMMRPRACRPRAVAAARIAQHDRGRAVAEQGDGDEIGDAHVVAARAQAAQIDREEQHVAARHGLARCGSRARARQRPRRSPARRSAGARPGVRRAVG